MDWYGHLRPWLFRRPPEEIHHLTLRALQWMPKVLFTAPKMKPVHCMGIEFPNRVGLAAGCDVSGDYFPGLFKLGFGHIEVGTVTPKPQEGNPQPRMFRYPDQSVLINRMGFANKGVDYLVERLQKVKDPGGILGISIGKNRDTTLENAAADYLECIDKVYPFARYIAFNLSSPNTPGLRQLQEPEVLRELLLQFKTRQLALAQKHGVHVPLVVKVSPDETSERYAAMAEVFLECEIEGVIATNTTVDHSRLQTATQEMGGLSGALLTERSTQVLAELSGLLQGKVTLIGLGGIMNEQDAHAKITSGASLLQVYTGFIYGGPDWLAKLIDAV